MAKMPEIWHVFRQFHKTVPHGKGECSAPQIGKETNDDDSESKEQGYKHMLSLLSLHAIYALIRAVEIEGFAKIESTISTALINALIACSDNKAYVCL